MMLPYDFVVVGGGFDGAPALVWVDDGKHPPPPVIFVGVCAKGMHCGTSKCRRNGAHVSYWLPEEDGIPSHVERYRKQEEFVERDEAEEDGLRGQAVYAIGGLLDPRNFGAKARTSTGTGKGSMVMALVAEWGEPWPRMHWRVEEVQ